MHRRLCSALGAATVIVALAAPAFASAAPPATLPGSTPSWATPANQVGSIPNDQRRSFVVYLRLRQSDQLDAQIAAVSDPASPRYGQYLSPAAFRAAYAPSDADVAAVRAWLTQAGFTVSGQVPQNNRWLAASGTVTQIESAFGAQLRAYRADGQTLPAPNADLQVPADVAARIAGVVGLDGSNRLTRPFTASAAPDAGPGASAAPTSSPDAPPSPGYRNAPPCSSYFGEKLARTLPKAYGAYQSYIPCGYLPSQLQSAYGVQGPIASGLDGRGQTVAIVDAFASPTIRQDVSQYSRLHGLPPAAYRQVVPPGIFGVPEDEDCDAQGWYGEQTLDVEAVHTMAPKAGILYVGGQDCYDEALLNALNTIVDGGLAQIVTNSWGDAGEDVDQGIVQAYNDTFRQAAVEGIGMYFSSGDDGDEVADVGERTVDFPADNPLVTAVGGTSLGVGRAGDYQFETGWSTAGTALNDAGTAWGPAPPGDYVYGSGGGTSQLFSQPWYQRGVVPNSIARYFGWQKGRAVPDISTVGDPHTGMRVGQTQTFSDGTYYDEYRIGGTSLSSPLMAGIMALADQAAGRPHGFANPALYRLAGSAALHDVQRTPTEPKAVVRVNYANDENAADGTETLLRSFDVPTTIFTRPGYDDVTGIGSPNGSAFLSALAGR
ncbi:MAG TPA: S53 family peptidase [Solirubrobacteraceae bacterium]|nr:S53 family peptidase [Solirubrobacteraceae bacterium]